ncbi:MAG TPA: alpha/beta hydrolase [Acidobacteriaceae bacterium]|nr:alpha/beta hydrolase [Acidobacteriaceae bacterium]
MRLSALLSVLAVFAIAATVSAQKPDWPPPPGYTTLHLWPHGAPGAPVASGPEVDTTRSSDNSIASRPLIRLGNVTDPTLTLYAAKGKNTGAAVVVFPGGGYRILAIDLEGTEVCDWLNNIGVNCILVKYRVPGADPKNPASGPYPKSEAALQDAQRAVGLTRAHAAEWKIDPKRIGVLGFSAGGHLSVAISTHYEKRLYPTIDEADQVSCRPDFAVVVYPGYLADTEHSMLDQLDLHPDAQTPPTIIIQAEDDPVHVENSTTWFLALKRAKVPAELHLYAQGGHGYGLRPTSLPITSWPKLVETWLRTIHVTR